VTTKGTINVKKGMIDSASSKMSVAIADYGIEIPKLVADNIAKTVDISIQADYQPLSAVR